MREHLPFSPESDALDTYAGASTAELLQSIVKAEGGMVAYMANVHIRLSGTTAYERVLEFSEQIREVTRPRHRSGDELYIDEVRDGSIAEGFIEGAAVAIAGIDMFMPHLIPVLGETVKQTLDDEEDRLRAFAPPHAPGTFKKAYVQAVLRDQNAYTKRYEEDFGPIIDALQRTRSYGVNAYNGMRTGLGFIIKQAEVAYADDMSDLKALAQRLNDEAMRPGKKPEKGKHRATEAPTIIDTAIEQFFAGESSRSPRHSTGT